MKFCVDSEIDDPSVVYSTLPMEEEFFFPEM